MSNPVPEHQEGEEEIDQQDEQFDDEVDSMDEQQTGDQLETEESVPQQQEEPVEEKMNVEPPKVAAPVAKKTPVPEGVEKNTRPTKRSRTEQRKSPVDSTLATVDPELTCKPKHLINFTDFLDLKGQYDAYSNIIENSKTPFNRLPETFQNTYHDLCTELKQVKHLAMEWLTKLQSTNHLADSIANDYRKGMSDNNKNIKAQAGVLGFVAASRSYIDANVAQVVGENTQLKQQLLEYQKVKPAPLPAPMKVAQQPRSNAVPRTAKSQKSQKSQQPVERSTGKVLSGEYDYWMNHAEENPETSSSLNDFWARV